MEKGSSDIYLCVPEMSAFLEFSEIWLTMESKFVFTS